METIKIKKPLLMQTKSAEIVGSNDDLLTEILLRLPINSIIDFKLVSKQWHSIITNPKFCHLRSCRKPDPPMGLLSDSYVSIEYVPFSKLGLTKAPQILKDFFGICILQSCNGLLLCQKIDPEKIDREFFVCNPTTKQFSFISKLQVIRNQGFEFREMGLAFDPTKSPHYHVVCVHQYWVNPNALISDNLWFQIQIYSSETRSWNICGEPDRGRLQFYHPVYWKGAIHWMNFTTSEHMYFEIDHQVLRRIPMSPVIERRCKWVHYFEESRDHLHLIAAGPYLLSFDVYEMKSDYYEWFVKYKVDLSPVVSCYPEISWDLNNNRNCYNFNVLTLVRYEEEDEKEPFLVLRIPGKVLRYNLVSMTFKELPMFVGDKGVNLSEKSIQDIKEIVNEIFWCKGFLYMESLSCV